MIDLRLWRVLLLGVPMALVIAMFSLQEVPEPLAPSLPPDAFEGTAATSLAKDLAAEAPEPRPGSDDDEALGEAVLARFKEIDSMEVSEQRFEGSYDGDDFELRNLIGILPGPSERQVAVMAHRDVLEGSGAASSVASTAALLEIAAGFAGSTHDKTLVFVSTDGGSIGALGARRFASDYSNASLLDAVVVLSQPGAGNLTTPMVIPWSTGLRSGGIRLSETARAMVSEQVDRPAGNESFLADLFRLAIPSGLGEQGPLVEGDFEAVRLSSSGELPPAPADDDPNDVNPDTLGRFGRSALSLMLAVDTAREPLDHGPSTYIGLAGNLLPGWTLSLFALTLLLPVAVVGMGGVAVAAGSPLDALRAVGWVGLRSVPFLLGFVAVSAAAVVGLVPSPEFPFLPSAEELGTAGKIAVGVAGLLFAVSAFLLRPLLGPAPDLAELAGPAALSLAALATFAIWLINPYLALLVALGLQLWVLAAARVLPGRLAAAGLVLVGLIPALAAVAALAGRFDAGIGVVWDLLFMFTGGQLPDRLALLGCLLLGTGLAIVAAAGGARADSEQLNLRGMIARGRVLEQRRERKARRGPSRRKGRGRRRRDREEPPEARPEELPEAPEQPPQEEPAADPRMWSKPVASSSEPSKPSTTAPSPFSTRPIWVIPGSSPSSPAT
jgi:hypothetical protein